MAHRTPNARHLPVKQVSNADLVNASMPADTQRFFDDHIKIIPVGFPSARLSSADPTEQSVLSRSLDLGDGLVATPMEEYRAASDIDFGLRFGAGTDHLPVTHEHAETLVVHADDHQDVDAGLVERLVANLNAAADQLDKVSAMADAITADFDSVANIGDMNEYYDSFKIGELRTIASQAGFKGAYKGPKKAELVRFCVLESLRLGRRV